MWEPFPLLSLHHVHCIPPCPRFSGWGEVHKEGRGREQDGRERMEGG